MHRESIGLLGRGEGLFFQARLANSSSPITALPVLPRNGCNSRRPEASGLLRRGPDTKPFVSSSGQHHKNTT